MNATLQKKLIALAISAVSLAAFASDQDCTKAAKTDWVSKKDVQATLEQQGYKVKRVKTEGSCYEAKVTDKDGNKRELIINPQDGKVTGEEES